MANKSRQRGKSSDQAARPEQSQARQPGRQGPMGRAGQPAECGTCYVFLASDDASYMTGQVLHPNGGEIIGG